MAADRMRMRSRTGVAVAAVLLAAVLLGGSPAFAKKRHKTVRCHTTVKLIHGHRKRVRRCTRTGKPKAPARPATTTCGGEAPPAKPGGGQWVCTFDDEFDASTGDPNSLNRQLWSPQVSKYSAYLTGPPGAQACYVDSPNNISVSGGALHLTVRREPSLFFCGLLPTQYTSGMVSTNNSFSQEYGRFEVRALLPQTTQPGLQETLWLWPINANLYGQWPASGEIDFSEFFSEYSYDDIPYLHYLFNSSTTNYATNSNVNTTQCWIDVSQYHDYAVTWEPGTITVTIDGKTCLTDNYLASNAPAPGPFDQPFYIALTQALGVMSNAFNAQRTPLPATTSIDYVRVWK